MDIETLKEIIKKNTGKHAAFINDAMIAERYYKNQTDVLYSEYKKDDEGNPLRNADNRIPRNFHGLIINQKAAYAFTAPPLFDVGNEQANKTITKILGDEYVKNCMDLCINAANCSVAWVHYWEDDDGFQWAVVDSKQIIPIWSKGLKKKLLGILRVYNETDEETGDIYTIYEYWTDKECQAFRRLSAETIDGPYESYNMFVDPKTGEEIDRYNHNFGKVPFIPFYNNNIVANDLVNIKKLIDVYDKVYSGFINDLDDIQELIFVLSGYGGTELNGFLNDLKKYKTIKVDGDEGSNPGVSTLSIEIPIEARKTVLDVTRKAIFEQGQGFDPCPENFGNQSGEALKFMYSLLEMKTGLMQTEFMVGFSKLVRAICDYKGIKCDNIIQTWTRTSIKNDTELAQICKDSVGVISKRTILKNHPFVEDAEQEIKYLEEEEQKAQEKLDTMQQAFEQDQGGVNNEE